MTNDLVPRIIRQADAPAPVPHQLTAPLAARTPLAVELPDGVVFPNTGPSLRHDRLIRLHARAAARLFGGLPQPLDAAVWDGVVDTMLHRMRNAIERAPDHRATFGLPPLYRSMRGPVAVNALAPEGVARYVLDTLTEAFGLEGIESMRADKKLAGAVFYPLIAEIHNNGRRDGDTSRREKDVSYDMADGLFAALLEHQYPLSANTPMPGQTEGGWQSAKMHHETIGIRRLTHAAIFVAQTFGAASQYAPQKGRAEAKAHWRDFLGGKMAARDTAEAQEQTRLQLEQQAAVQEQGETTTFDFSPLPTPVPPASPPTTEGDIRGLFADF